MRRLSPATPRRQETYKALDTCKDFNPKVTENLDELIRGLKQAEAAFWDDLFIPQKGEMSDAFREDVSKTFTLLITKAEAVKKEIKERAEEKAELELAVKRAGLEVYKSKMRHH